MIIPTPLTPEQVAEIRHNCHVCITAGTRLLKELEADPQIRLTQPMSMVMVYAIRHQIQALDAGMLLSAGGRPQFISSLERAAYETLLNVLAIRWLSGPIGSVVYGPGKNARRFVAFWNITTTRMIREGGDFADVLVNLGIHPAEAGKRQRLLIQRARTSMRQYGFGVNTTSWFHHQGVTGMFERLWPAGSVPRFPPQLFPLEGGREAWVEWFTHCWKGNSNQIHANIAGLTSGQFDAKGKWPSVGPIVSYVNLSRLWSVCFMGVFAAARAINRLPALNAIVAVCERETHELE